MTKTAQTKETSTTEKGSELPEQDAAKQKPDDEQSNSSDSTLKGSESEQTYDENEIFFTVPTRSKRDQRNSPKQSNKKARKEMGVSMGKSRMFKI